MYQSGRGKGIKVDSGKEERKNTRLGAGSYLSVSMPLRSLGCKLSPWICLPIKCLTSCRHGRRIRVELEAHMKCDRCGGMMVYEKFYHQTEQFWGWRCVYCGEYIDPVIWENRRFRGANENLRFVFTKKPLNGG